jgi:3'-phosphoadenosine 5'-phosphosulfate sulfotransferase (PAPS reductase)/FAD synthetase
MKKKFIASCSFGKDSLAAILLRLEHNEPIDEIVYCKIMFNKEISAEYPEHENWIHHHAIPHLKNKYNLKTTIVQSDHTYTDHFFQVRQRGKFVGNLVGFPMMLGSWCNGRLKLNPIIKWQKQAGDYVAIVGIAADETRRIERKTVKDAVLPLVQHRVTEAEAFEICHRHSLVSPAYSGGRLRLGCWFCPKQRVGELRRLCFDYPLLWAELLSLDRCSPVSFTPRQTVRDLDKRFQREKKECLLHYISKEGV